MGIQHWETCPIHHRVEVSSFRSSLIREHHPNMYTYIYIYIYYINIRIYHIVMSCILQVRWTQEPLTVLARSSRWVMISGTIGLMPSPSPTQAPKKWQSEMKTLIKQFCASLGSGWGRKTKSQRGHFFVSTVVKKQCLAVLDKVFWNTSLQTLQKVSSPSRVRAV